MLDDLLTSSKGPGVIGALLGMVVLAGFCGLGLAVFNGDLGGEPRMTLPELVEKQSKKIESLRNEQLKIEEQIAQRKERNAMRSKTEGLRTRERIAAEEGEKISAQVAAARQGIEHLKAARLKYRGDYRAAERGRAVGEKIGELKAADGTLFKNVEIKSVSAIGIKIGHANGIKRIPYEDLPLAMQDRFQFSEDEKTAALAREQAIVKKFNEGAEIDKKRKAARRDAMAKQQKADEKNEARARIAKLEAEISAARGRISSYRRQASDYRRLHADAMARGSMSMHLGKAKEADRKADNLERAIAQAQGQIAQLQQKISN